MNVKVLSDITDKLAGERLKFEVVNAKLIGKNEVIYFRGNDIVFALVKPTDAKGVYIKKSAEIELAKDVVITDKEKILFEIETKIKEVSLYQYLSSLTGKFEEFNFRLIEVGESMIRKMGN